LFVRGTAGMYKTDESPDPVCSASTAWTTSQCPEAAGQRVPGASREKVGLQYTWSPGETTSIETTASFSLKCGCVSGESCCALPGMLPGKFGSSRSKSQSFGSNEPSKPGRGLKKGRSMMYAVESFTNGRTRRVPSPA
jgi:hypothetical protein